MAKAKKSKQKSVKPSKSLTRKEQRKQRAIQKKENKRTFFSKKPQTKVILEETATARKRPLVLAPTQPTKPNKKTLKSPVQAYQSIEQLLSSGDALIDDDESIASDFSDEEVNIKMREAGMSLKKTTTSKSPQIKIQMPKRGKVQQTRPDIDEQHRRDVQRQKELEQASRKQRIKQLHLQNDEDDVEIAKLEKKLKLNRTKDKNRLVRKMFNDGLDYALDLCLDDEEERAKLELKEKRKNALKAQDEFDEDDMDDIDEGGSGDDYSDNEENGEEEVGSEDSGAEGSDKNEEDVSKEPDYKEDIYGRKRDSEGKIINESADTNTNQPQKYIPPHLRAKLGTTQDEGNNKQAEILSRLRKQCKGLLNRLSEFNLHKIASGIEELYMRNSRYSMNETVTTLLNEALILKTMTKDRMVQEHMVLLAYLHAHIGSEIGAHFLQSYIEQFAALLDDQQIYNLPIEDKRLNNIVLLLSYMYIFKIYEHRLLLEIIDKLATSLCEKTIECLLLIFQSVGFKLRKDDPVAFKQMIQNVQQRIATAPLEMKENLRLKFMVETLNAVKNNNINKIPQFDPELAENLRKRLKAMLRNDKYVTTLNIAMADLLRADQVGKWWIVGSAWSGNINDVAAAQNKSTNESSSGGHRFSEQLLNLAKQQKMNTDERRNIFCIIMSAEDYIDAFEKILHLALKDQRAVAYVIMHCCLNEARSNPYYAHLALKFCNYNRKYQLAFQFASWDRINDIEKLSKQQIKNFGQFLLHLIVNAGLALSVLKIVDFLQLQKSSFLLMREVVVNLLLRPTEQEVYEVFERIAKNAKLHNFKNSLRLFMQHFLLKQETLKLNLSEDKFILLRKRIDYVDKLLSYVDL